MDPAVLTMGILHLDVSIPRTKPPTGILKQSKFLEFIATRKVKFTRSHESNYLKHFYALPTAARSR